MILGFDLGGLFSGATGLVADGVFRSMADLVAAGAGWCLDQLGSVLSDPLAADLGSGWSAIEFNRMVGLAAPVSLVFLLACCIQAIVRQDAAMMLRAVAIQLPLAVILTASAVELVGLAGQVVDSLSEYMARGSIDNAGLFTYRLSAPLMSLVVASSVPVFLIIVLGLLVVAGALVLWMEMVVRALAVEAALLFLPLALASLLWPAVSHLARRLVEILAALLLSKFVVVCLLALAAAALAQSHDPAGMATGLGLLLIATLSPFALLRLIPVAEFAAVAHLEGMGRRNMARSLHSGWSMANLGTDVLRRSPGLGSAGSRGGPTDVSGRSASLERDGDPPGGGVPVQERPDLRGPLGPLADPVTWAKRPAGGSEG